MISALILAVTLAGQCPPGVACQPLPQMKVITPVRSIGEKCWAWRQRADGSPGWVWGWWASNGMFYYFADEQPSAGSTGAIGNVAADYGLDMKGLASTAHGQIDTNDPDLGEKLFKPDPADDCDGGQCPNRPRPNPLRPDSEPIDFSKWYTPVAILSAAVLLLLFRRKGSASEPVA